ncbi:hypothetical protein PM082_019068 [Marasmius tenuissimus]|nr:hypothetical protein PM082_019068 [Marasmius tenuissimus]
MTQGNSPPPPTRTDRLRARLGLVKANSLSNKNRQRKTHTPAKLVEIMRTAGLVYKLKENLAIWKRNNDKKAQDGQSIANLDSEDCRSVVNGWFEPWFQKWFDKPVW